MSEREVHFKNLFLVSQTGDQASYRVLLQELSSLLKAYLMKTMNPRLRSKEQVEDLVQEILVSIHRKRDLYSVDRPFLPWVYAIARYRLIDSLRMESRRPECVQWVDKFESLVSSEMPKFPEEEDGMSLMSDLNEREQQILKLAKVDEIPLEQIAKQKGMSLSAVKVSIHRSLKTLRKKADKSGLNHGE
jgi:RNA polymerase sigma-70 factor (ECF subfamily)